MLPIGKCVGIARGPGVEIERLWRGRSSFETHVLEIRSITTAGIRTALASSARLLLGADGPYLGSELPNSNLANGRDSLVQ